jgi:hypothetical protein
LADLLGIRYAVTHEGDTTAATLADSGHWKQVFSGPSGLVYENVRALPRAFVVPQGIPASSQAALDGLRAATFDPTHVVFLTGPSTPALGSDQSASFVARPATYAAVSANRSVVKTGSGSAGWLVVTDLMYPGWIARVDGKPTEIETADYIFRAVYLDGSPHTVEFDFEPPSVQRGVVLSGIAWLAVISIVGASVWQRRHANQISRQST